MAAKAGKYTANRAIGAAYLVRPRESGIEESSVRSLGNLQAVASRQGRDIKGGAVCEEVQPVLESRLNFATLDRV